jgi:hypothetical protein
MTTPLDRWAPDDFTRARGDALQRAIPSAQGSVLAHDGEATQREIPPAVRAFAEWVRTWPGIRSAGLGRSPAKASTAGRRRDLHEEGRAVDAMLAAPGTPEGRAAGDALAAFVVENADRLGVQGVIWHGTEWFASNVGPAWEPYDGGDAHTSHPHIELSPAVLAWGAEGMRARIAEVVASPARPSGTSWGAVALGGAMGWAAWALARWWRSR